MQDGGSEENIDLITESNQANQNASLLPNIFVRDYSIRIEAGKNNFCAFIDLKLMNKLSVFYTLSLIFIFDIIWPLGYSALNVKTTRNL